MIFSLPNSNTLTLVLTLLCLAYCLTMVVGNPVTKAPDEDLPSKYRCSTELANTIHFICNGRTQSLADLYPQSFGSRSKRFSPDESFYRPLQNGPIHECCINICTYKDIRRYCAPD